MDDLERKKKRARDAGAPKVDPDSSDPCVDAVGEGPPEPTRLTDTSGHAEYFSSVSVLLAQQEPVTAVLLAGLASALQSGHNVAVLVDTLTASVTNADILERLSDLQDVAQPAQLQFTAVTPQLRALITTPATGSVMRQKLRAVNTAIRKNDDATVEHALNESIDTALTDSATDAAVFGCLFDLQDVAQPAQPKFTAVTPQLQALITTPATGSVMRQKLRAVNTAIRKNDDATVEHALNESIDTALESNRCGAHASILQHLFDVEDAHCKVNAKYQPHRADLERAITASNQQLAHHLRRLLKELRGKADSTQVTLLLRQYHSAGGAMTGVVEAISRATFPEQLRPLMDAARAKGTLDVNAFFAYQGNLTNAPAKRVVFLNGAQYASVNTRQVPVLFQEGMVQWRVNWDKLVAITGPSGCGKTVMGLLGLATDTQVLVYVGEPPLLVDTPETQRKAAYETRVRVSGTVQQFAMQARLKGTPPKTAKDLNRRAMETFLLEGLDAIFGDVSNDNPPGVVFFFDELGDNDDNSKQVRSGVRELATAFHGGNCIFSAALKEKLGVKLVGIAMGGTGLDAEKAVGSLGEPGECRTVTPNYQDLQWRHLHDRVDDTTTVSTPDAEANLTAALRLPRLAALVLIRAFDKCQQGRATMQMLADCLAIAINDFARLNGLSRLVAGSKDDLAKERAAAARRNEVAQCCVALLLDPPPSVEDLSPFSRFVIARCGLVNVHIDEVKAKKSKGTKKAKAKKAKTKKAGDDKQESGTVRFSIGDGERLVLRHFCALTRHQPTGDGIERAVADFLCLAVAVSRGKTLSQFINALNRFFSHGVQHPDDHVTVRIPEPTLTAPPELRDHVLAATDAEVLSLNYKIEATPPGTEMLESTEQFKVEKKKTAILVNGDGAASWDVQLVLIVTDPKTAVEAEKGEWKDEIPPEKLSQVTLEVQTKRYLDSSFSAADFDEEKQKASNALRSAVPEASSCGFVAVVGRKLWCADWLLEENSGPVWHVNLANAGALGVVPFHVQARPDDNLSPYTKAVSVSTAGILFEPNCDEYDCCSD